MSQRLLTALIVIGCAVSCFAPEPLAAKAKIESAAWLTGTWELNESGRAVTEHWMPPAGGTMLGMSRTVARGRTVEHEFILLREDEDGGLSYVAKPSHDFPQRILYTLKNSTNLQAAVEGTKNGKTRRLEFNYTRTPPRS